MKTHILKPTTPPTVAGAPAPDKPELYSPFCRAHDSASLHCAPRDDNLNQNTLA
jgi:hypothetical protein